MKLSIFGDADSSYQTLRDVDWSGLAKTLLNWPNLQEVVVECDVPKAILMESRKDACEHIAAGMSCLRNRLSFEIRVR